MKDGLTALTLLRCFLRTFVVTAAYNPRGLQNIGFLYAIEPVLVALYGPGKELRAARMRYARNYNCHPFWTPMLLGIFVRMEAGIASGKMPEAILKNLKDTAANTLSAIGDALFSGALLHAWALLASCLVLSGLPAAAAILTLALFLLLQIFRLLLFIYGLRRGMAALFALRRFDLIDWSDRLKCFNAFLLALFLLLALPGAPAPVWAALVLYLPLAAWAVGKLHLSRVLISLALLVVCVLLHVSGLFGEIPFLRQ